MGTHNSAPFQLLFSKAVVPQLQPVVLQKVLATGYISPAAPESAPLPCWVMWGKRKESVQLQAFVLQTTGHSPLHFLVGGEEKT